MIRSNNCQDEQPSIRAASSSSSGTSRMKIDMTAIPIGKLSATCVRISAVEVLCQPSILNITYQGPTKVIGGIM